MFSHLKTGLIVGAAVIGAIPTAVVLVKGWDALEPVTQRHAPATAGLSIAPARPTPAPDPIDAAPRPNDRLNAGFELLANTPTSQAQTPADAVPPRPAAEPDPAPVAAPTPAPGLRTSVADPSAPTSIRVSTIPLAGPAPLLPPVAPAPGLPKADVPPPQPAPLTTAAVTPAPAEATVKPQPAPVRSATAAAAPPAATAEADKAHIPQNLALAVAEVESGFDARKHGEDGKIGLFQIRLTIARALGFHGTADDLDDPATNIKWGIKYLAGAYKRAGGDTCKTAMKFIAGHYQEDYKPVHAAYCRKLEARIAAN